MSGGCPFPGEIDGLYQQQDWDCKNETDGETSLQGSAAGASVSSPLPKHPFSLIALLHCSAPLYTCARPDSARHSQLCSAGDPDSLCSSISSGNPIIQLPPWDLIWHCLASGIWHLAPSIQSKPPPPPLLPTRDETRLKTTPLFALIASQPARRDLLAL